jgi:hypothetical protein
MLYKRKEGGLSKKENIVQLQSTGPGPFRG